MPSVTGDWDNIPEEMESVKPKSTFVDPRTCKLTDLVKGGKKVRFDHYKNNEFWYKHEDGLLFPIHLNEVNNASAQPTMLAEDKAIFFMRWIKRYLESFKTV